jgi:nicotinate dehydrogenase subunit B
MNRAESNENPSRRGFLALGGAGLFVFFAAEPAGAVPQAAPQGYPSDWNAYLRIGADGRVTCFSGKVELGQGTTTTLAQLLAEELDVAFESVDMVMADTGVCPWDRATVGSLGIWQFGPVLRAAGAEARAVLLEMAAERLGAPVERLRVSNGVVTDPATPAKRVTYAEMVGGKRIDRHIKGAPLKDPAGYRIQGRSPRRLDAADKVTGRAKYSADVILPGLLHARLLRPPALGATLKSADTSEAEKLPGVRVIRDEGQIAVLHERPDIAAQALGLVKAEFTPAAPGPDDQTIFDHLVKNAPALKTLAEKGNLAEGEKLAASVVAHRYLNSYVAHAVIETYSVTVSIEGAKVTVWASTQAPFRVKQEVAQGLGVPQENVRVISTYVGGAFGGKCHGTPPVEAARLARLTGKPVQVVFDRAEEFLWGVLRPAAVLDIRSGLTADGKLAFWDYKAYGCGPQEADTIYEAPNRRTVSAGSWDPSANPPGYHPLRVGVWRAPAGSTHTFARESHMDMLAAKAGVDPVEFRQRNLPDKRMRRLLSAAAEQFAWKPAKAPSGRGAGVSCSIYTGTYMVTIAQVNVDRKTGRVKVERVVFAHDQGRTASPEGTRQQIEGSIIMGIGYALSEEIQFKGGDVLTKNFDSYELPRYSALPKMETILCDSGAAVTGCGEPPVVNLGAAIANAIFDATGVRLLQLPMTPERVLAALKSAGAQG